MPATFSRVIVIVLDGAGIGALPDAADYGDQGSNTMITGYAPVGGGVGSAVREALSEAMPIRSRRSRSSISARGERGRVPGETFATSDPVAVLTRSLSRSADPRGARTERGGWRDGCARQRRGRRHRPGA